MTILKSDLRQIDYAEWGTMLDALTDQVQAYCEEKHITFDLVVPILRSGGFTGLHLASKLGITQVLPVQYKYLYKSAERIVKKFELPKLAFTVPDTAHILIADSNTVWGGIATRAIEDIRARYPNATLYFASANLDYSLQTLPHVERLFYGAVSNESRNLGPKEEKRRSITHDVIIFPWEDLEEQWEEIRAGET